MTVRTMITEKKDTGCVDNELRPIYVGDHVPIFLHWWSACCEHCVDGEVKEDANCRSGYGLYYEGKLIGALCKIEGWPKRERD